MQWPLSLPRLAVRRKPPREDLAFFLVSFATWFIILYGFVI